MLTHVVREGLLALPAAAFFAWYLWDEIRAARGARGDE